MGKIVGICAVLLVGAVGFILLTGGPEATVLFDAFRSQPLPFRAAWTVIAVVPVALLVCAAWLCSILVRQRRAAQALELRLNGVRGGVKALVGTQVDVEAAMHQLVRTDPEDAIGALQQRLTEAEHVAQVQQGRNEAGDLQSRVDYLRTQQQLLQDRLAPVLERRRSIERLFMELEGRQNDIARSLDEIAGGDDAVAVNLGLKDMMEFVRRGHERCDDIERAAKVMAGVKEDYAELRSRLDPFAAAADGVASRVKELREERDRLTAAIDSLQQTPEGPLAERVQRFADDKKALDGRLSELNVEFSRLATLRKELAGLFANFDRVLDILAIGERGDGAAGVDARTEELAAFIEEMQARLDDIERRVGIFRQLKTRLGDLHSQLVPLEAAEGGVASLIEELKEIRDKLVAKMRRIDESEDGDLAARVRKFAEIKKELEDRVAMLAEQFAKLATIRKDITGLFDKLSSAVATSAN